MSESKASRWRGGASRLDGDVWLVGEGPAARDACVALTDAGVAPVPAGLAEVIERAKTADWVLVAGTSPGELVEAAERLRARGLPVALHLGEAPALYRALGRKMWGLDCVALPPDDRQLLDGLMLRLRDVVVAGLALVALAPIFLAIGLLVKRSSPGPVFFATEVVGRHGRTFVWRKFRSMRVASLEDEHRRRERYREFVAAGTPQGRDRSESLKVIDDSRVTPVGRVIRRHSLDELPQLWNVLRGEMTLVGPRPCLPYEYEIQEPWHRRRYQVTPGLSGPWQVYGRSRVTVHEMALIDYCYGRVRSFWLDLRIILKTVLVVITGEGGR